MTDLALPIASDVTVYATNPREMAQAQSGMVGWCQRKIDECSRQRDDFVENMQRVTDAGWPRSTPARRGVSCYRSTPRIGYRER